MKGLALVLLGMLAACAGSAQPDVPVESVSYTRGPCYGVCPVYRVTVNADGSGLFEGERFTAVTGRRRFTVTPAAWRAFTAKLAPFRPQGTVDINMENTARCQLMATDHPSAIVTWAGGGRNDRLGYYYGCRDEANRTLAAALTEAPTLLPIAGMIGPQR
jgi:hypothetical protein